MVYDVSDAMSVFEAETAVTPVTDGVWATRLSSNWNIGDYCNGGYALVPVLRAMAELQASGASSEDALKPDPLSVTTHYLRPVVGEVDTEVRCRLVRAGRTVATLQGELWQEGTQRLSVNALLGKLPTTDTSDNTPAFESTNGAAVKGAIGGDSAFIKRPSITVPAPPIPSPEECSRRSELAQTVHLTLMSRVDIAIHPDQVQSGSSNRARVDGWIRFNDGSAPSTFALPFFADAFPPALYPVLGQVGWMPTLELTVQVRRRPSPGWIQGRFGSNDLTDGLMIESGQLWDSGGNLVAQSRQLGMLLY